MLNLTKSFYRYLRLACEHLSFKRSCTKSNSIINSQKSSLSDSFPVINLSRTPANLTPEQQLKFISNKHKKIYLKKPFDLNQKKKKMSENFQPSSGHVSYGGEFAISDAGPQVPAASQMHQESSETCTLQPKWCRCQVPSNFRIWESVENKLDNNSNTLKFKLISYNVLAQYLLEIHPYLYKNCSPENLRWEVRASRLYQEITQLDPDILCLQEVQATHLTTFYDKLESLGYLRIFKQKTGHSGDGCAIYFKRSIFHLADYLTVEFYQPELPILNRDNIGLIAKLIPNCSPHTPILVATTHLLFNPRRTDVRLAQIQMLLAEIDRFSYYCNSNGSGYLPVILAGDFNSHPDSALVRFLDRGHISVESLRDTSDWRRIGITDNCQHLAVYLDRLQGLHCTDHNRLKIQNTDYDLNICQLESEEDYTNDYCELFNSASINHFLQLVSVYDRIKCNGEPEASTHQNLWTTVDYIYFSRHSYLNLLKRLRLPTAAECESLGCLPNDVYASDHLALGAVLEIKPS